MKIEGFNGIFNEYSVNLYTRLSKKIDVDIIKYQRERLSNEKHKSVIN